MGATQTDNVVNAQFNRLHIWHAGTYPADQLSRAGQNECDCQCDCACPEPLLAAEGRIHPTLLAAGARPLPLAAHVFTGQIEGRTYLIPPHLPGVLVCETRALEHLQAHGATTPALQRLAALLIDAGALAFPAAVPQAAARSPACPRR